MLNERENEPSSKASGGPFFSGVELAEIYEFPDGDGSGQVIAVISLGGVFDRNDIAAHLERAGLAPPTIDVVEVGNAPPDHNSQDFSISMIIEISASIAPAARFIVFQAPNTNEGYTEALSAVVQSEHRPSICIVTYGGDEATFDETAIRTIERQFQAARERNITVVVSAGDGVGDINYPATSPWVLACGATTLRVSRSTGSPSETPWPEAQASNPVTVRESARFARPDWQRALGMPPGRRLVPDVAAVGNPETGYLSTVDGNQVVLGGTTGSAALWAGLIARLNQQLGRNVGHLTPTLYRLAGTEALRTVAEGTDTAEWYPTTGLGVPNGRRLLQRIGVAVREQIVSYAADDLHASDDLEFTEDVNVFAALIAARSVRPPISVGLFGDWGSGKSFFMRMLRERVDVLAEASRRARTASEPQETLFCANVVQIDFNAWHYIDANLWASLVARIFEGLAEHGAADESYVEALAHLQTSKLLLAEAASRRDAAEQAMAAAKKRLTTRKDELEKVENAIADSPTVIEAAQRLSSVVGTDVSSQSLAELAEMAEDLHGGLAELRTGWRAVDSSETLWSRRRLLAVLAALAVIAVAGLVWGIAANAAVRGWLTLAGSLLASAIVVMTAVLPVARDASRAAAKVLGHAERRRQEEIARLERTLEERKIAVEQAQAEVDHAQTPASTGVYQFIEERYRSDDYRRQMGLIGLIQRDLRSLSDRLVEAARVADGNLPIERVVLYVDDLDRCPPALVVQVLQAVHLLLAFPLFVVVVGVDSRWLLRALQHEYAVMLDHADGRSDVDEERAYWAATPQNYLEKIFQIPFWIRGMRSETYARLIQSLTSEAPTGNTSSATRIGDTATPRAGGTVDLDEFDSTPDTSLFTRPAATSKGTPGTIDLAPPQLILSTQEEGFLAELAAFVNTPRMAKRLVNLYRLLRAYVRDLDEFIGTADAPGTYRQVALLLALVLGAPQYAAIVLDLVEDAPSDDDLVSLLLKLCASDAPTTEDSPFVALRPAIEQVAPSLRGADVASAREWVSLIRRFSMIRGADAPDTPPEVDQPSKRAHP